MGNLQVLVYGAALGEIEYSKEPLSSYRRMNEMATEEQVIEYPKVLKQVSVVLDLQCRIYCTRVLKSSFSSF